MMLPLPIQGLECRSSEDVPGAVPLQGPTGHLNTLTPHSSFHSPIRGSTGSFSLQIFSECMPCALGKELGSEAERDCRIQSTRDTDVTGTVLYWTQ